MPSIKRQTFEVAGVADTELEARVTAWERKYGVPSSAMVEAFTEDGVFLETDDYLEWSHDWAALQASRHQGT
jgi:hypothetical protein